MVSLLKKWIMQEESSSLLISHLLGKIIRIVGTLPTFRTSMVLCSPTPVLHVINLLTQFSREVLHYVSVRLHNQVLRWWSGWIGATQVYVIVQVAIVGRPNVGKSSLLNRLCGADRAIVTNIPGTTRDVVDVQVSFVLALYGLCVCILGVHVLLNLCCTRYHLS